MRLHRLTLQAVGPFPARHTIDLDALSSSGLFLLEGPTGAGKSTLIDAVVFALYGTVAGESSEDRLHSDHAEPGTTPFVELVFSTGAGTYRVWRSPKHLRPKQRGEGMTEQNARARLWRLPSPEAGDEAAEPLSSQVQEVGAELGRIVVLDRGQFTQTVVLPQGRFAAFLRSKPEERRAVLQDIFGTEVYDRLQRRLAELAKEARRSVEGAVREVTAAAGDLGRCAAAAPSDAEGTEETGVTPGDTGPGDPGPSLHEAATSLDGARIEELAEAACAAWTAREEQAERDRHEAGEAEERSRERLAAAERLAERLARRAALLEAESRLSAEAGEMAEAARRLDLARRAERVEADLAARDRAREAREAAVTELARAREAAAEQGIHVPGPPSLGGEEPSEALRRSHAELMATVARLEDLAALEAGLPERRRDLTARQEEAAQRRVETAALAERVAARPVERAALSDQLTEGVEARFERAVADRDRAQQVVAAARSADAAQEEAELAEQRVGRAAGEAREALAAEGALRERWIAGMAGALAEGLAPGEPCPVCGGSEHPSPAEPAPDHPGEEELQRAQSGREAAERRLAGAREALARARTEAAARREAAEGRSTEQAQEQLAKAEAEAAAAQQAVSRRRETEEAIRRHDEETARLQAELGEARRAEAAEAARLSSAEEALAAEERRCVAAREGQESVTARLAALRSRAALTARLLEALRAEAEAGTVLHDAEDRLVRALERAGLAEERAAREALLSAAETATLDARVTAHRTESARVHDGLAEPAIAALEGTEEPAVEAWRERHGQALAARDRAAAAASEARYRCAQVREAADRLRGALRAHDALVARAAPVLRVAELATAGEGNALDTTLATYVLLRRFEDVVAAANDRLSTISSGRYALQRIDEREGGQRARKAGLGLQVRDHVTDMPRDPHTLSGGETFYVSLCLALGLADVVTAEAGGVELGTLFVDEGFGSLDPETLDAVMAELTRLRDGGRAVGVISHVSELKDRIADRVSVRRTAEGASTLLMRG